MDQPQGTSWPGPPGLCPPPQLALALIASNPAGLCQEQWGAVGLGSRGGQWGHKEGVGGKILG